MLPSDTINYFVGFELYRRNRVALLLPSLSDPDIKFPENALETAETTSNGEGQQPLVDNRQSNEFDPDRIPLSNLSERVPEVEYDVVVPQGLVEEAVNEFGKNYVWTLEQPIESRIAVSTQLAFIREDQEHSSDPVDESGKITRNLHDSIGAFLRSEHDIFVDTDPVVDDN